MSTSTVEKNGNKNYTPREIRELLGIDNSQIQQLCKTADVKLKKNEKGLTYFTQDDAKALSKAKFTGKEISKLPVKKAPQGSNTLSPSSVLKLVDTLNDIEKNITQRVSSLLDEKLDGMDDVVMELIRVKTENETMRFRINELNKENYKLKKEINSFKKVPFGFYAKTSDDNQLF